MKNNRQSPGAFVCLGLLLFLAAAGCSNDNPSDSTPDLFTPTPLPPGIPAPLRIYSVQEAPTPSTGATLYLIDVKMNLEGDKEADFTKAAIFECLVSVSYGAQELISNSSLVDAVDVDASPCRGIDKPDDLGKFLVGTPKKAGALTFTIKMRGVDGKVILQGSTPALAVQPGGTVTQDLVALPTPK